MFGSCFNEHCRETRSYALSIGVTSGRACRSLKSRTVNQLLQVDGCTQIAIYYQAAIFTPILALAQAHIQLYLAALRTLLCRWVKPICQKHFTAIPPTFVLQLTPKFVHAHIFNGLCHSVDTQIYPCYRFLLSGRPRNLNLIMARNPGITQRWTIVLAGFIGFQPA